MDSVFLSLVLMFACMISNSVSQPCVDGDRYGVESPVSQSGSLDTSATTFFVDGQNEADYTIMCCGTVKNWEVVLDMSDAAVTVPATLEFHLWESSGGTTNTKVTSNTFTINTITNGLQLFTPATPTSLDVNYRFGWTASPNIVENKAAGSNVNMYMFNAAAGGTLDTSTAASTAVYTPALRLLVAPGNSPQFDSPPAGTTVTLNTIAAVNSAVTTITTSDLDSGDVVTVTMTSTSGDFAFTPGTGQVTTNNSLAGVTRTETLTFTATDKCGNTASRTVTVSIINDPPVIVNLPASSVISEDQSTELLLKTIVATDTVDAVTCSLDATTAPFHVKLIPSSSDYGIYVNASANFDYSTQKQYDLTVRCSDVEFDVTKRYIVFLVKNARPVISNLPGQTSLSTTANSGAIVFSVAATDAEGDDITYAMACEDPTCPLSISPTTGVITLTQDIPTLSTTGYDVNITASDPKNAGLVTVLTVLITDINDAVRFTNLPATIPVLENTAQGTSVFTVSASDLDTAQTLTFSITSATSNGLDYFSIDPSTGVVSCISSTLDYETLPATSFDFTMEVTDGVSTDTSTFSIDIVNRNERPTFSQTAYSLTVNEGLGGTVLGTPAMVVTDPDAGDSYYYDMDCGAYTKYFSMNINSGQVAYQSNYDLDSGLPTSVNCVVTATDANGLSSTAALYLAILDTNDHTPTFAPDAYTFTTSYYAGAGTVIGAVTATDGDSGANGALTYAIDQTNLAQEYFSIDNSGNIALALPVSGLGYGTTVSVKAKVFDGGALTDEAPVTIIISDTTTQAVTAATPRYRRFFEDPKNIPWFIACMLLLAVLSGFLCWIAYTCRGKNSYTALRKLCRRRKWKLWRDKKQDNPKEKTHQIAPQPKPVEPIRTVRNPPPPTSLQSWRHGY